MRGLAGIGCCNGGGCGFGCVGCVLCVGFGVGFDCGLGCEASVGCGVGCLEEWI